MSPGCYWQHSASVCFLSRGSLHSRTLLLLAERAWQRTQALTARGGAEQNALDMLQVALARARTCNVHRLRQDRRKGSATLQHAHSGARQHLLAPFGARLACACARSGILPASLYTSAFSKRRNVPVTLPNNAAWDAKVLLRSQLSRIARLIIGSLGANAEKTKAGQHTQNGA